MQEERRSFKPSAKRDTPVKENLRLFKLLLAGDKGTEAFCLRAKADYASVNGKLHGLFVSKDRLTALLPLDGRTAVKDRRQGQPSRTDVKDSRQGSIHSKSAVVYYIPGIY